MPLIALVGQVQDVFIDELYELAKQAAVPPAEWGDFLRLQVTAECASWCLLDATLMALAL